MGYMRHHAIVVTSHRETAHTGPTRTVAGIREAHAKAVEIFQVDSHGMVSEIIRSPINEYFSFMIVPDGSYEGWPESDAGNRLRKEFLDWLKSQKWEDESTPFDWAEIQYGDGDLQSRMTDDSDRKKRRAEAKS